MVVAGNVELAEVKRLAEKYFAPIPKGPENKRNLPVEPAQTEARSLTVERDVPIAIYKAYHMCSRYDKEYYAVDLISDITFKRKLLTFIQCFDKRKTIV